MKALYTILAILTTLLGFSQTNNVRGRVLDKNNFPLPGAVIKLANGELTTISDFDGYFTFPDLEEALQL